MNTQIARHLLNLQAVTLSPEEPFTWSSGMKSPIYCDNRLLLGYPQERSEVIEAFAILIKTYFPDADLIAGTATAGIPHAAILADRMNLPMCYVRSEAKSHGKGKQIEGAVSKGMKAVVIEDLISTGKSSITAANALSKEGIEVLGVAAIFTYELEAASLQFEQENLRVQTITDFSTLIDTAQQEGMITSSQLALLQKWKENPQGWLQNV